MRGVIFWIFQHWLPVAASGLGPFWLFLNSDQFGALDLIGTGALSFIGVFLIFGVALDVFSKPHKEERWYLFGVALLGLGSVLVLLAGGTTTAYAVLVQLPSHLNPRTPPPSVADAILYSVTSLTIYVMGCVVTLLARRHLLRHSIIEA